MDKLIAFLLSSDGLAGSGHIIILVYMFLLLRRVNKLEKQLIAIARNTGQLAALFEPDEPLIPPTEIDGRQP